MRHFGICLGLKPGKKAIPIGKLVHKGLIYVERIELHSFIPMDVTSLHIATQETILVYSSESVELDDDLRCYGTIFRYCLLHVV